MQKETDPCDPDDIKPDRSLLTWEKWVRNRNEQTKFLGKRLDREPADLVMNLLEKVREDKERKSVLEDAQLTKKLRTCRGALWDPPLKLKQHCYCEPVYEVHLKPTEIGRPPIIEHIAVPQLIQTKEKGLSGVPERQKFKQLDAEYEKYREKRENKLKTKIKKIDPYKPHTKDLMIKGYLPKPPPKKVNIPVVAITSADDHNERTVEGAYALRINNTIIVKSTPGISLDYVEKMRKEDWHEDCRNWNYYFNTPIKKACRSKLFLSNLGTVTVRYCWKRVKKTIPYIPEELTTQVFFLNKNENLISPGQTKEVSFTFLSDTPGIYSESWEFRPLNVCFFDSLTEKMIVNLQADATENASCISKKIEKVKRQLTKKSLFKMCYDILNDVVNKATITEPQIYPYKKMLLEADLFIMKNSVCFYHQTEVSKMKELYKEMRPGEEWDLSIESWRDVMMQKDYDDRMHYYDLLKLSHRELLKPWSEGDGLLKAKQRAMNVILSKLADEFDREYNNLVQLYNNDTDTSKTASQILRKSSDGLQQHDLIRNLFYVRMLDHVGDTIEQCAGILSSLDLNRWIEFDFCQWF